MSNERSSTELEQRDLSLRFEGGVRAEVSLHGEADLVKMVDRELRKARRHWSARLNNSDGHGGMLTSHHQRRLLDELPEPLNYLAANIVVQNEKYWLKTGMRESYGAECVREQGLTNNQRSWIDDVAERMEGTADE